MHNNIPISRLADGYDFYGYLIPKVALLMYFRPEVSKEFIISNFTMHNVYSKSTGKYYK